MLKSFFPKEVKVKITIDDIRLVSNLTKNETIKFTKKPFVYVILGFTQSQSGELCDIPGFIQLIPGTYKSDKPINISGIDKIHLKYDCTQRSIVNGTREPILYSFDFSSTPGQKIYKEPGTKHFRKVIKSALSHKRFFLENDDHKSVDFNGETISFTCQLIKI